MDAYIYATNQQHSLIQYQHFVDLILGIIFGMPRCIWPHQYERTKSNRCIYVYLITQINQLHTWGHLWDKANSLFSITLGIEMTEQICNFYGSLTTTKNLFYNLTFLRWSWLITSHKFGHARVYLTDHIYLKWLRSFVVSLDVQTHTKMQLHTSICLWGIIV